jgi:hypothetical protein
MAEVPLLTHVELRSDLFPAYPGEDEETNPGRYGKRLAEFLVAELGKAGLVCETPFAEDWGWQIKVQNETFPLWIGVGVYDEYPDGFLCFIEPNTPSIRRFFKRIDTRGPVEALQRAIDAALRAETGIRDIKWWTDTDFNGPGTSSS